MWFFIVSVQLGGEKTHVEFVRDACRVKLVIEQEHALLRLGVCLTSHAHMIFCLIWNLRFVLEHEQYGIFYTSGDGSAFAPVIRPPTTSVPPHWSTQHHLATAAQ